MVENGSPHSYAAHHRAARALRRVRAACACAFVRARVVAEGLEVRALGPLAFDSETNPHYLLELGALLYSSDELEESERFDELAIDLATIRNLPEVCK